MSANNNNEISIKNLKGKLEKSLKILRAYDWLVDAYVLDFYVDNHWAKLPKCWRAHLENLQPESFTFLLNEHEQHSFTIWPLSLLALKKLLKELCIDRTQNKNLHSQLPQSALVNHPKLKHFFTKCVKPKKRHEIQEMAAICKRSCDDTNIDFVIDFGAGLGHLARILGYGFGVQVCCLEMQQQLNLQASVIDLQMETIAKKYLSATEIATFKRPVHINLCLTSEMQPHEFIDKIQHAFNLKNVNFRFGIIGLHPCGDLCAILMRLFLNCKQAKFLNFVGCCYMKLSTPVVQVNNDSKQFGYPMSKYLCHQSLNSAHLSYEAREISCHAIEMYRDRLLMGDYENLKVHSFRAAAECILIKNWPELKHCGLKSVKHTVGMEFEDYFYKAVRNLPAVHLSAIELQSTVTRADLLNWKRIVVFYTFRLMFAPLVESIILYDRLLFLIENDCHVEINPIFDPRLSPRNHITNAYKIS